MVQHDKHLRLAVIGLGTMGRQHVRVLDKLANVRLVAGVDPDQEKRAAILDRYDISTFSTADKLFEIGIDAAVVATPTPLHFRITTDLLRAGIDVLVEKPVASSVDEATAMGRLADSLDRVIMVGHIERFNPAVRALKGIIDNRLIGEVVTIAGRRVGFSQPEDESASVIFDLAIHDLDIIGYLLECKGEVVYAHSAHIEGRAGPDHVDICLKFGSSFVYLQANWITPVKIRTLGVTGTSGFAEIDFVDQKVQVYQGDDSVSTSNEWNLFTGTKHSKPSFIQINLEEPLFLELQHFVECVTDRKLPLTNILDATIALELAGRATTMSSGGT